MVCELFSIGYETIGLYILLHHPNLNTATITIYSSKSSTNHRPIIMTLSSRFYPSNNHVLNLVTSYFMLFVFTLCLFYCHVHTKSRVIKFWGFFMYLLFLGIVQNNTMKLDNALTQIGKLCFWETFEWCDMLFLTSYRGRSTETGSLTFRILCKCDN